jgi:hypothetical protein
MSSSASEPGGTAPVEWALLEGEDTTSLHPEDPEHWVAVYAELVSTTNRMLDGATARRAARQLNGLPKADVDEREVAILRSKTKFFRERLRWWTERGIELWTRER